MSDFVARTHRYRAGWLALLVGTRLEGRQSWLCDAAVLGGLAYPALRYRRQDPACTWAPARPNQATDKRGPRRATRADAAKREHLFQVHHAATAPHRDESLLLDAQRRRGPRDPLIDLTLLQDSVKATYVLGKTPSLGSFCQNPGHFRSSPFAGRQSHTSRIPTERRNYNKFPHALFFFFFFYISKER